MDFSSSGSKTHPQSIFSSLASIHEGAADFELSSGYLAASGEVAMANEPGWYSGSTKSSIAPRDSAAVFQKQHIRRSLMPHNYIRDTNGCRRSSFSL
jgi:hypothetical protein